MADPLGLKAAAKRRDNKARQTATSSTPAKKEPKKTGNLTRTGEGKVITKGAARKAGKDAAKRHGFGKNTTRNSSKEAVAKHKKQGSGGSKAKPKPKPKKKK